jgi:hypothetical protein
MTANLRNPILLGRGSPVDSPAQIHEMGPAPKLDKRIGRTTFSGSDGYR